MSQTHHDTMIPYMTLREHFAAMALPACIAASFTQSDKEIAERAVKIADELVKALK